MLRTRKRLGDLLIDTGKITKEQLKEILNKQRGSGKKLGELLIDEKILSEDDIIEVLEKQLGIKKVKLDIVKVDKKAIETIPESLARKYNVIPISFLGNKMRVAMSDPLNIFAIDDIKIASGFDVIPLIATIRDILDAIDRYYSSQYVEKVAAELTNENTAKNNDKQEEELTVDDVRNAPVVKLIDSIIINAVKARASDIHIEPFEKYIKIRYRVDGVLQEVLRTSKESLAALTARIKILSNLNIAEKRIPQDGRIITEVDGKKIDLRVSILPTVHGEKIVIRILKKDGSLLNKEKLGMRQYDLNKLDNIIMSPNGIILVTGPTGSGKSTTLYAILNELNTDDINIITVEDPVEFMIEGINQVNVNVKTGLTFAAGLRSILRQDPDIVMVGEIRDAETAHIAIRAAITGHKVLSTIHTNDSASAIVRLTDMGIEPYLVSTALSGVVAQRLVRKICPNCRQAYNAEEYEKKILHCDVNDELTLYRGKGCATCNGTGYLGRVGIYEIMEITKELREAMQRNAGTEEIRELSKKQGIKTLKSACIDLVIDGVTTVDELIRNTFLNE
ncbi:type II secretion system protein E [Clostridium tepidiprofundi DSM 19306]|uniref:Type II secretion system protein E n=1 Tax=Clostridium tepidiprofundi DSM 19306 TaxID=1121338 RepID=A0A151B5W6_9CLOT|nr:ATPase, T2SS/T4P/T4SS family [Clostridium tepidiprofundi]KYH35331.1 type II secretion system protein E [Clostridium tepidiprofundi DSM 19306]